MMDTELKRLLIETAFVGAGYGLFREAEQILRAIELNGGQPFPVAVCRAISLMGQGDLAGAGKLLMPYVNESGAASEADALLALVSLKQGQSRSAEFYLQRCEKAGDVLEQMAVNLRRDFSGGGVQHGY